MQQQRSECLVSDIHGKLHPTFVDRIARPRSVEEIAAVIHDAATTNKAVSIAGGRHAMGGQQFGAGTVLIDMTAMNRILSLDIERGEATAEAGIQWPELLTGLQYRQAGVTDPWSIIQKQTGADRLSLGGALSSNIHGRGLTMRPIIGDVSAFTLVDPDGVTRTCSRTENADLFRLAIGGYGLFGVIATVTLRLARRRQLQRIVEVVDVDELMPAFDARIADGFTYGDFQFSIDANHHDFLRQGVFSCYRPIDSDEPIPAGQRALSSSDWRTLLHLGHVDKRKAVDAYTAHYLATSGQRYWSDAHQMAEYLDGYHVDLDALLDATAPGSEVITEIYVPRHALPWFMADVRRDFRVNQVDLIYGTVRLVERDDESFLAWAREPWACVIFNLHTEHTRIGLVRATGAFQRLIDLAIAHGSSYYLTYHRFATRQQVEACHPNFVAFLREKQRRDPDSRFESDWFRHYRLMFADAL
jgi:FAD/FMN-containing dehydrogenase